MAVTYIPALLVAAFGVMTSKDRSLRQLVGIAHTREI